MGVWDAKPHRHFAKPVHIATGYSLATSFLGRQTWTSVCRNKAMFAEK